MTEIKRALLFINLHKTNVQNLADEIVRELQKRHIEADSFTFENKGEFFREGEYDLAFSLGGDGTVLFAARAMAPLGVPIFPINLGTLGFIAAVPPGEWALVFDQWRDGKVGISDRIMLDVAVERRGKLFTRGVCLNDMVISASGIAKIIRLQVESEMEFPREFMRLGQYRSDGLIVATPTGSTAYSVAAGGPILEPEMEAFIINPICPFTLSNRPLVVSARETVFVELEAEQRSGILLTLDGQVTEPLEPGDRISIRRASYTARLIASNRRVFYNALRTKLNWSGTWGGGDA
jgi:NAD+ kinase